MITIRKSLVTMAFVCLMTVSTSAAELVMFDSKACPWCAKWHAQIGVDAYNATAQGKQAPLKVHVLGTDMTPDIKKLMPIIGTPTFVLLENGVEIDRFEGYPGKERFYGRLQHALDKMTGADKQYKTIIIQ